MGCSLFESLQIQYNILDMHISVTEISFDKEYTVEFPTKVGNLSLIIDLDHKFPLEKPKIKVCPRVNHKWVDNTGQILAPGLINVRIFNNKYLA